MANSIYNTIEFHRQKLSKKDAQELLQDIGKHSQAANRSWVEDVTRIQPKFDPDEIVENLQAFRLSCLKGAAAFAQLAEVLESQLKTSNSNTYK